MTTPRSEITLYDNDKNKIKVTSHFIQVKGTQYLIRNIDTIGQKKEEPSLSDRNLPIFSLGAGLAFILAAIADESQIEQRRDWFALGITLVLTGVTWFSFLKTKHTLTLTTNGQKEAIHTSENADEINEIKTALMKAMDTWFGFDGDADKKGDEKKGDGKDGHSKNGKVNARDAAKVKAA